MRLSALFHPHQGIPDAAIREKDFMRLVTGIHGQLTDTWMNSGEYIATTIL